MSFKSIWGLLLVLACATTAADDTDFLESRIVNGVETFELLTTGALLLGSNPATATSWCSGTMVGCRTFLTAAHCVCNSVGQNCQGTNSPDPGDYQVYLQHSGFHGVDHIEVFPSFNFPDGDVAIVKLQQSVDGFAPTPINTDQSPAFDSQGLIAGFGRSGGNNFDYGIKRKGLVRSNACQFGFPDSDFVCWTFSNPVGNPGDDSNTCNADSGGPLFMDFGNGEVVAGITSGGTNSNCLPTDQSYDTNVFAYQQWIQFMSGPDLLNSSCGILPQIDALLDVNGFSGVVNAQNPEGRDSFEVASGTRVLRVTMNSEDDNQNFDFYVKAGAPPSPTDFDCAGTGSGQYAACEFDAPTAGTWHSLVRRIAGSGNYQVTATAVPDIARGFTIVLSSDQNSIQSGEVYSLDMNLSNETDILQNFELNLSLVFPNGNRVPLANSGPLNLAAQGKVEKTLDLPLPNTLPKLTFGIVASIVESGGGPTISESYLSFDIR